MPKITEATLQLHREICEQLPRTPIKFHYIFNLRDFSRVYEGIYQISSDKFTTVEAVVRLWRNEITRVYADRLINMKDRTLVTDKLCQDIVRTYFPEQADYVLQEPLLFGDFRFSLPIEEEEHEDPRLYEDLGDFDFVKTKFEKLLKDYNEDDDKRKPMNLVLFNDALDHLIRIHRILRMPRGNALLIGVGGSGKQSLTRLAAFTAEHEMFQIALSKQYTENNFREDIKQLYTLLSEKSVCFLMTDAHIKEEGFLELINNILTIGMVPALYEEGEKENLTQTVEEDMKKAGIPLTKDNKWTYFINKARDNLHLVLAFSPAGDTLRIRCRNFPGLVNNNSIDWFFTWPEEALTAVANHFLAKENLSEDHKDNVISHIVKVHMSIFDYSVEFEEKLRRKNHVTPKNYLDYINTYVNIIKDNRKQIDMQVVRLESGLVKLLEAAEAVEVMSKELAIRKKDVDEKKAEVEQIIADIHSRSEIANEQQNRANEKQQELIVQNEKISKDRAEADIALQEAVPALEAAAEALSVLDPKKLTEVKSFTNPPEAVRDVCMCVLILKPLGSETPPESDGWLAAKQMLTSSNLIGKIRNYEKDSITSGMYKKLSVYFQKQAFNYEKVKDNSQAAANLFMWVEAMKKYYEVNKKIEPLRKELKIATQKLESAQRELLQIEEQLKKLNAEIADLSEKREINEIQLAKLSEEAETMERRLLAASKLITGLGGEKIRWSADSYKLKEDKEKLVGDCLLSSSFLSYTGPFNFEFRMKMLYEDWILDIQEREIPLSENFRIETLMTNDVEGAKWASQGLPQDELSIQNGILTTNSSRWPLCIDPQEQAVVWIREKEKDKNLVKASLNDANFAKQLEGALRFGFSFIFENVDEEIDPMIDPVLEKAYVVQAGQKMIHFAGNEVEWDNDFKLFLTTKLSNPQYSPEIMAKTMIINYTVTIQGLEDQLLNEIVSHDRNDLEEARKKLVVEMSDNQTKRKDLEETLLKELSSVSGSILDNDELIATLEETKQKSVFISKAIEDAKETKSDIDKARNAYQPAALRGSILFFSMVGLSAISKMYEYSLSNYLRVFR